MLVHTQDNVHLHILKVNGKKENEDTQWSSWSLLVTYVTPTACSIFLSFIHNLNFLFIMNF